MLLALPELELDEDGVEQAVVPPTHAPDEHVVTFDHTPREPQVWYVVLLPDLHE